GVGRRNVVLIIFFINLLVFGFLAFQIYVLHNSYRGLYKNTGQQGVSSKVLPPNTCPERLITEKDKQTTVYWNGQTLPVAGEEQSWVEENCPGVLE
ncbi:MAG: hypothetical protein HY424_00695, partial [Candidatus Levybacteria bacterium]|nr:hypothetical protein [Candidatus Levybacteria bacterium]